MNLLSIQIHWIWIQVGIRILGYTINFERKNLKQFERKTIFFFISAFFVKTIRAKCHLKKLVLKFNLWTANLYLKSYIFCLHFILYLHVWIRIPNTDPEGSWAVSCCWVVSWPPSRKVLSQLAPAPQPTHPTTHTQLTCRNRPTLLLPDPLSQGVQYGSLYNCTLSNCTFFCLSQLPSV